MNCQITESQREKRLGSWFAGSFSESHLQNMHYSVETVLLGCWLLSTVFRYGKRTWYSAHTYYVYIILYTTYKTRNLNNEQPSTSFHCRKLQNCPPARIHNPFELHWSFRFRWWKLFQARMGPDRNKTSYNNRPWSCFCMRSRSSAFVALHHLSYLKVFAKSEVNELQAARSNSSRSIWRIGLVWRPTVFIYLVGSKCVLSLIHKLTWLPNIANA